MADSIGFDFSGLQHLVADLGAVEPETIKRTRQAVEVTARHVKDDWRDEAKRANRRSARGYPSAIDYDMDLDTDGQIGAEIGPKLGGQGSLGALEESSGEWRSAPQHNARKALRSNVADFERGILKAAKGVTGD